MLLTNTIWIRMFLSKINHRVIVEPDEIVGAVNKENINHNTTLLVALPNITNTDKSFEMQNRWT